MYSQSVEDHHGRGRGGSTDAEGDRAQSQGREVSRMFPCHQISAEGIRTNPEKIAEVQLWKVPNIVKDLRSLLGFCSFYGRVIKGFSNLTGPLHNVVDACLRNNSSSRSKQLFGSL